MNNPANTPEPSPINADENQPALWDLVIKDFELGLCNRSKEYKDGLIQLMDDRNLFGIEKYGVPLKINNGRSFINDSLSENLDMLAYLKGILCEENQPYKRWLIEQSYENAQESILMLYEYFLMEKNE